MNSFDVKCQLLNRWFLVVFWAIENNNFLHFCKWVGLLILLLDTASAASILEPSSHSFKMIFTFEVASSSILTLYIKERLLSFVSATTLFSSSSHTLCFKPLILNFKLFNSCKLSSYVFLSVVLELGSLNAFLNK